MTELTGAQVEERLREAVALRRLMTVASPSNHSDEQSKDRIVTDPASQEHAIERAAEALSWLMWLDREEAALVLARLEGARWKMVCWQFATSRPTAHRRLRHALRLIAWRLNGNELPTNRSRRHLEQQMRAAGM